MKQEEKEFAALVKEHKSTIYSICYMFSKDMEQVQMLYKRIQKLGLFDRAIIMLWLENLSYDGIGEIEKGKLKSEN